MLDRITSIARVDGSEVAAVSGACRHVRMVYPSRLSLLLVALLLLSSALNAQTVLVGNSAIEANLDSDVVGTAEAFPATAAISGQVGSINLFLDESSTATKVYVGIYQDASGKPGTLLTQGSATQLFPGTWNTVSVTAVSITSGTPYWIAVLGASGGKPYFYDRTTTSCQSQASSQANLTSLPTSWSKGKTFNTCYVSAYAVAGTFAATVILGDQAVETNLDKNPAGQAEAFPLAANSSGSVTGLALYLDPTSGTGPVYAGLYADNTGKPGTLLGQGSTTSPVAGQWNQVAITPSTVSAGKKYWIAVLGTQTTSPYFRDRQTTACKSQTSSQTNLTSLPATWSAGTSWSTCYIAAYGLSGAGTPVLSISPATLSFAAVQAGANPSSQNLTVSNTGTGTLAFTDSSDSTWLSVTPASGTAPQTLQVSAAVGTLTPGTYTGHVTVTAPGATNSPATVAVTFTVAPFVPPSISASASPAANANGWNNSSVTVSFTCTAGSYAIQTCPSPVVVSAQGAGQAVTGTVVDTAGNTNTAKVTLNIDLTAPTVSIGSPANGAFLTTSPTTVTGSILDSLSGIASVSCDGVSGTVQGGSYSCSIPLSAGADTISVQATDLAGNTSSQSVNATLIVPASIGSFSPPSSSIGSIVTLQGNGFTQSGFQPVVTLNQDGGGTIAAPLSSVTANALSFVIPSGAASGPISVTVDGLTAASSTPLTIVGSSSFSLSAGPNSVTLLPGQTANVQISLASGNGFTQLAALSVSGLPAGVTGLFQPPQVPAGGFSILTLNAPLGQTTGVSALTITATATVEGTTENQSTGVSLNVQAPSGSATFMGRVAVTDAYDTPLVGVTVQFTGTNYTGAQTGCSGSTTTDGAGNFVLNGLSSSCTGPQMVEYDPTTVTSPPGKYSGVTLSYVLTPGQVTTPGIIVHLPNVTSAETFSISQNSSTTQTFVSNTIPGVSITIYPGTTFALADGSQPNPFPLSVVEIPYDKIPDFMPPNPTEDPIFAMSIEPFNSSSSQPIAVSYPNRKNTPPGTDMPLTSLNPTMGMMVNYGTGAVSSDGTQIIPDPDPAHPGHLYGVSHFDWFFPLPGGGPGPNPGGGGGPGGGDPVDLSSGLLVVSKTDIAFGGARGQVAVTRTYRGGGQTNSYGPFGNGSSHNYNYALDLSNAAPASGSGVINLLTPDGNAFPFSQQSNGTYSNGTIPSLAGGVISPPQQGVYNLRFKDGTIFQFQPFIQDLNFGTLNVAFLTAIKDSNGNTTTVRRDQSGVLLSITDPAGRSLNFAYDSAVHIASIIDSLGRSVQYTYNSSGNLASVADVNGGVTTYGYDNQNNLITITDPRGITYLQNVYDQNGRVTKQTMADGGVYTFNYTQLNPTIPSSPVIQTIVTDPLLHTTTYRYNSAGFLVSVIDAKGQMTVFDVDSSTNLLKSVTDPMQRMTTFTYDSSANLTSITRLAGSAGAATTSMTYDPTFNSLASVTDALGHTTTFNIDPSTGNLLGVTEPMGETASYLYDNSGELQTFTDPLGNPTNYSYVNGDLISVSDPIGRTTHYTRDAMGRAVAVTNALGQTAQFVYNALNQVTQITDPLGSNTMLTYDPNGNLLSVVDPNQGTNSYSYDSMDRLATHTDPLGQTETYQWDQDGNVVQFTDRRGVITGYAYDPLNRIGAVTFGGGQSSTNYTYDAGGRYTQIADSVTGTITQSFDGMDRLLSESTPQGTVGFSYDLVGRRKTFQVAGQPAVAYTYDNDNRLTQIAQGSSTVSFLDNANSQRSLTTLPNGVTIGYTYNAASELSAIGYKLGSTSLGSLVYAYDAAGRRNSVSGSFASTGLPQALSSASYSRDNQLTKLGSQTMTYDRNGNLTSDGSRSYTWNSRNQLVSISGTVSASFTYDPFGRRTKKTIGTATTSYLYDGENIVQELNAGVPSANVLTDLTADGYLQRTDGSGSVSFLTDGVGNTVALTGANGASIAQYTYEPFGNTSITGSSGNPFQFGGRENDGTGLYYYRARYYSPQMGRFIGEDPLGVLAGGANTYKYGHDSPAVWNDPFGLWTISIGGTVSGNIGILSGSYSGGFVVDSSGNIGVYNTWTPFPAGSFGSGDVSNVGWPNSPRYYPLNPNPGAKPIQPWGANAGVTLAVSNGQSICSLSGPFVDFSGGGGEGLTVTGDTFAGKDNKGKVVGGAGITLGGGGGSPAKTSLAVTNTVITPITGRKGNCP